MKNDYRLTERGAQTRRIVSIVLGGLAVLGAVFVGFLFFYAAAEPQRTANPADVFDEEVPEQGVGVPDGGALTNVPTQAAPDSPARTIGDPSAD